MAQLHRSSWIDVAKYEPSLKDHVQDIITFSYEATNTSQDSVRWSIRSPGPSSLLDSDVTIRLPIKIYPRRCFRFKEYANHKQGNLHGMDVGLAQANAAFADIAETILKTSTSSPGLERNLGTCERMSSIWRSVSSVVCEVNGSQISYSPSDWIHLTDTFLMTDEDERQGLGPMDSGSAGNFVGRAYQMRPKAQVTDNGDMYNEDLLQQSVWIAGPEHQADVGMAKRVAKFKAEITHSHDAADINEPAGGSARYDGTADGGSFTEALAGPPYLYTLVSKIPCGIFSYYQNGMGSKRRSMIPFITSLNVQINFKSNPTRFFSMLQSTAVQGNLATQQGTLVAPQTNIAHLSGVFTADNAKTQIPDSTSTIQIAPTAPTLIARWIRPKSSHQLQSAYVLSSPRWVTYKKQAASTALAVAGGYTFRWNQIKLSSLPPLMIISCKPKLQYLAGQDDYWSFGTTFANGAYADTFDCLFGGGEDKATSLKITINEKASLVSTYTPRDLFNILLKAVPGYRYDYATWKREKQLIVLTPDCFPSDKPASVFFPSTINIECAFELSVRHKAWKSQNQGPAAVDQFYQPNAGALSEASLSFFYEDSIALSANAAAVQQFMVNESAVSQKPVSSTAPTLDGLQL